jgi:hypothetical protein
MSLALDQDDDGNPTYAFKASLAGGLCQFTLKGDGLHWQIGRRGGSTQYDRIRRVRLSYRPVTMQSHRFITEIWAAHQPKLQIVSVSWRGVVSQERLDAAYAAFIAELHRRIAAADGRPEFSTGLPVVTYWIGVAAFAAVMLATAALSWRALRTTQWSAGAVITIFFAVFAYQIGQYFYRNRPMRYDPASLPTTVMPQADGQM